MAEFFSALWTYAFLQRAVLVGLLASVACGIMGTYVVARGVTYIAGGIAHAILGGMGIAFYLQVARGWDFLHPLYGAVVVALLAALIIGWVSLRARQREDSLIGAIWSVGMAIGIIFIAKTPGYNENLVSYLFGNILMVTSADLWLIAILDVIIVGATLTFYHQFQAVWFDEEFARLRGINVELYYLAILCLIAATVVLLITVVGIVMVIALLTLPAATAGLFSCSLYRNMFGAVILSIGVTLTGLLISYGPNLPAGATIILSAGAVYVTGLIINSRRLIGR